MKLSGTLYYRGIGFFFEKERESRVIVSVIVITFSKSYLRVFFFSFNSSFFLLLKLNKYIYIILINEQTLYPLLQFCTKRNDWEQGKQLWRFIYEIKWLKNIFLFLKFLSSMKAIWVVKYLCYLFKARKWGPVYGASRGI